MTTVWRIAVAILGGMFAAVAVNALLPDSNVEDRNGREGNDLRIYKADGQNHMLKTSGHSDLLIPGDWYKRENRLDLAVAISGKQNQSGDDLKGVASLESLLEPFQERPREARLIGFALGYGFAARSPSDIQVALGSPNETYLHFLLAGVLSVRARQPNPKPIFDAIASNWGSLLPATGDLRKELCQLCLRFSAESGSLDADKAIDLLTSQPDGIDKRGKPAKDAILQMTETVAVLSPLTFDALLLQLEKRYPGTLAEIIPMADMPSDTMVSLVKSLPEKVRNDLALTLSKKTLNGTPAEIQMLVACFPNPSEIPIEAAANISLALALLGPNALDAWLGKLDVKQRSRVFERLNQIQLSSFPNLPKDQQPRLLELRADQMLRTPCIRKDLPEQADFFESLLLECRGSESLPFLRAVVDSLKDDMGKKTSELRVSALRKLYGIQAELEGGESLVAIIQNASSAANVETQDNAEDILIIHDRKRVEQLRQETPDQALALRLDEKLMASLDLSRSYADLFQMYSDRIASAQGAGITSGVAAGIESFVKSSASRNRPIAVALIGKLPEGELREKTMQALASDWTKSDPIGASEWIAGLPPSRSRDIAASELVKGSHDDPEIALANAAAIQEPALRSQASASVVTRWKNLNPEAIGQLIEASPLPPGDKEALGKLLNAGESNAGNKRK